MPSRRARLLAFGLAGLGAGLVACFTGDSLIGAVCDVDEQCGVDQKCVNSICGSCQDGVVQAGELCLGASSEENVFGQVSNLLAFDPEADGAPILMATVNTNCEDPPLAGPPGSMGSACWEAYVFETDEDGDFMATRAIVNQDDPTEKLDGRVPRITSGDFDGQGTRDVALAIIPSDPNLDPSRLFVAHDFPYDDGPPTELDLSFTPATLLAADLDGDGLDDLVSSSQGANAIAIIRATPGQGFAAEQLSVIPGGYSPVLTEPVDMNGDGELDVPLILIPGGPGTPGEVGVYLNSGGNLGALSRLVIDGPTRPRDLATADFDQDGNMDVVVFASDLPPTDPKALVYRGQGDGSLVLDQTLYAGELPWSGITADVNHDGWPDIVIADFMEDKLPVHINREGSFPDYVTIDVAASPIQIMFADFDADTLDDIVVANANGVVAAVPGQN